MALAMLLSHVLQGSNEQPPSCSKTRAPCHDHIGCMVAELPGVADVSHLTPTVWLEAPCRALIFILFLFLLWLLPEVFIPICTARTALGAAAWRATAAGGTCGFACAGGGSAVREAGSSASPCGVRIVIHITARIICDTDKTSHLANCRWTGANFGRRRTLSFCRSQCM